MAFSQVRKVDPLEHVIAAKAVAFEEALQPAFTDYTKRVIRNAKVLSEALVSAGYDLVSGGSDNHLMLIDLSNKGVTGKEAERILGLADITANKNMVPFDTKSPFVTSGIRLGTAAITTRGFGEKEMLQLATWIDRALSKGEAEAVAVKQEVHQLAKTFPLHA